MTLKISLRDGEQMIVNGAVLRAIGRTDLCVENNVALLRGREVMTEAEATTPARRLYFSCMMAYVDQGNALRHQDEIVRFLRELMGALEVHAAKSVCASFAHKVATGDYYRALADCRTLIAYEAEVFARTDTKAA